MSPDRKTITEPRWHDREFLWRLAESPPQVQAIGWPRERISTSICRYLNSGFPVILGMVDEGRSDHEVTICGYIRLGQLAPELRDQAFQEDGYLRDVIPDLVDRANVESEVVAFLAIDDRKGPYQIVWLHQMLDQAIDKSSEQLSIPSGITLMAPLPAGLWLAARDAETVGADIFQEYLPKIWLDAEGLDPAGEEFRDAVAEMMASAEGKRQGPYAVRTYATTGTDYKRSIRQRCIGDRAIAAERAAYLRLPRFVWIVELIDRSRRQTRFAGDQPQECVVGELVIDASSPDIANTQVLFASLPGAVSRGQDTNVWLDSGFTPYGSGRWRQVADHLAASEDTFVRSKGTTIESARFLG